MRYICTPWYERVKEVIRYFKNQSLYSVVNQRNAEHFNNWWNK